MLAVFLFAVMERKVHFDSTFEGAVRHGREVMVRGL